MPIFGAERSVGSLRGWIWAAGIGFVAILVVQGMHDKKNQPADAGSGAAATALAKVSVRQATSISGYSRAQFGPAWADVNHNHCDTRDDVLARDLKGIKRAGNRCTVLSGVLADPYTGTSIHFTRGIKTSNLVQIDHVVALGNAWVTGAKSWTATKREQFANDPLNLLAVDAHSNEQKGDKSAAQWLPPATSDTCDYVSRQIAVKTKYHLAVTAAEHTTMGRVLHTCAGQELPRG